MVFFFWLILLYRLSFFFFFLILLLIVIIIIIIIINIIRISRLIIIVTNGVITVNTITAKISLVFFLMKFVLIWLLSSNRKKMKKNERKQCRYISVLRCLNLISFAVYIGDYRFTLYSTDSSNCFQIDR